MGTHKFFLDEEWKGDVGEAVFYVVMTVLMGAFAIALVANAPISDEDARLLLAPLYQGDFVRCPVLHPAMMRGAIWNDKV